MSTSSRLPWNSLENGRATAFLVAGLLWLADTTLLGLELFAGLSVLGTRGPVNAILYITGLVAAIVGLLGLYPGLVRRTRRLALVSLGIIAVAGIVVPVFLVWFVASSFSNLPGPVAPLGIVMFVVVALGFVLFGIASVRTRVPSRAVGMLVLAIPTAIVGWLTVGLVVYGGDVPAWMSPAIGAVMTCLLLAIGASLRIEDAPTDSTRAALGSPSK
jgi:hypothetical protein